MPAHLAKKAHEWLRWGVSRAMHRRPLRITAGPPLISFTFDDFPRTAWLNAGAVLGRYHLRATYYAAFGLMGKHGPVGEMFVREDARAVLNEGHELGCHTYGHDNAGRTTAAAFEASIVDNRRILDELATGLSFRTLSYPFSFPTPGVKKTAGRYFGCCRGGGQTFNSGIADLNSLGAYFLEQANGSPQAVRKIIDQACLARGWLIFGTHDVCAAPSRFGCTTDFFEEVVQYAARSGANILPVADALEALKQRVASSRGSVEETP
jgi:peptidoglycan/xylan/chitin deacetylase (PgdA/CDA1 family)